jgi:hypothetical protein
MPLVRSQDAADKKSIQQLCGCFEVEFKYAETFSPNKDYKIKEQYHAKALEWSGLVENSDKKFVMQHILVIDDSMIVKHWREDWTYETTDLLVYNQADNWKKVHFTPQQVKGQWTQSVWEINDAPRYEGTAIWVHQNGESFWKNSTDAPLPRREYTKRSDYNVLNRGNTIHITNNGWVHEQDNEKIIRKEGQADQLLAQEKGYNIYKRVDDSKCFAAKDWWSKNLTYWNTVRKNWDELIAQKEVITVRSEVKNQTLSRRLEDLETMALSNKQTDLGSKIKKVLEEHIN